MKTNEQSESDSLEPSAPSTRDVAAKIDRLREAAAPLLSWYESVRRDLPWRVDHDPYRVLVSEVMLQQTRVDVVVPRFEKFLERFPTVEDLATASEQDVLAEWSGLGYYRRARSLHAAARSVFENHGGRFPATPEGLQQLPGVGPYTAAAVSSIAFGVAVPVLDGNVERVLSRVLQNGESPKRAAVRRRLTEAARHLLVDDRAGDSNQALMELGATVCLPRGWRCSECPLRPICGAAAEGDPGRYPVATRGRAFEEWQWVFYLARRKSGEWLLTRRSEEESFLAGAWLPPGRPQRSMAREEASGSGESEERAALQHSQQIDELASQVGASAWSFGRTCRLRHGITHRRFQVEVREVLFELPSARDPSDEIAESSVPGSTSDSDSAAGARDPQELRWFAEGQLDGLHTSSLLHKIRRQTTSWDRQPTLPGTLT